MTARRPVDRASDWALDYCCWRRVDEEPKDGVRPADELIEEVCLRCGHHYRGTLDQCFDERTTHVCDPSKRKKIPEWALVNRKHDRSKA